MNVLSINLSFCIFPFTKIIGQSIRRMCEMQQGSCDKLLALNNLLTRRAKKERKKQQRLLIQFFWFSFFVAFVKALLKRTGRKCVALKKILFLDFNDECILFLRLIETIKTKPHHIFLLFVGCFFHETDKKLFWFYP